MSPSVQDGGVPGGVPGAWPLVGHIPHFLADKLGFLTRCGMGQGAAPLRLDRPTWLLRDPADIRHVLLSESTYDKLPSIEIGRAHV